MRMQTLLAGELARLSDVIEQAHYNVARHLSAISLRRRKSEMYRAALAATNIIALCTEHKKTLQDFVSVKTAKRLLLCVTVEIPAIREKSPENGCNQLLLSASLDLGKLLIGGLGFDFPHIESADKRAILRMIALNADYSQHPVRRYEAINAAYDAAKAAYGRHDCMTSVLEEALPRAISARNRVIQRAARKELLNQTAN